MAKTIKLLKKKVVPSHKGQKSSTTRKRELQEQKEVQLSTEAAEKGITVIELKRLKQRAVDEVKASGRHMHVHISAPRSSAEAPPTTPWKRWQ